jgi:pimeloyl-ACP methyl ester carboxylesterase
MPDLITSDGVRIHYMVYGQATSKTPLILTHGYSATAEMWQQQVEALSERFTLILWDMRGHGQSEYPTDPAAYSEAYSFRYGRYT